MSGRSDPAAAFLSGRMPMRRTEHLPRGARWARARAPSVGSSRGGSGSNSSTATRRSRRRTGVDIPYIFEKEGEAGFRVREARGHRRTDAAGRAWWSRRGAARSWTRQPRAPARPGPRRVSSDVRRPATRANAPRQRPAPAQQCRPPRHARAADASSVRRCMRRSPTITVDTDGRKVKTVVEQICAQLAAARRRA